MPHFLKYLTLGVCTLLLTVLLNLHRFSLAVPSELREALIAPPHSLPTHTVTAQTSSGDRIEQGRQHYREGRYADAIALWQQALASFNSPTETLNRAMVLSNLALAYRQLGQWEKANPAIQESLSLLDRSGRRTSEGLSTLAQALNTQGNLQLAQGQSQAALDSWERATQIYRQVNDSTGEARSLINQAIALRVLGFHRRSLQTLERVTAQLNAQSDPEIRMALLRSLGETQRLIGNLEGSQKHLQAALQLADQRQLPHQAAIALSLGNTLRMQAQQKESLAERTQNPTTRSQANQLFQAARSQYQKVAEQSASPLLRVQAQLNQLDILIHLQAWAEADALWGSLPESLEKLPLSRSAITAAIKLAESGMEIGERSPCRTPQCPTAPQIQRILTTAIQQAQTLQDAQTEAYARGSLGHLYEQQAQLSPALELTQQALTLASVNQASESAYRWQWQLGRLYKTQGNTKNAIVAYDTAFHTVQALRNDLLFLNSDVQFTFRDRIEPLYREYVNLLLPTTHSDITDDAQAQSVRAAIAKEVVDDLRLAELENFLSCSLVSVSDAGSRATIDALADADGRTAIVYPILLGDRLEVLLKRPNQPLVRYPSQPVAQQTVEQTLEELRKSLERPYFSSRRGKPAAIQLYQWLIQPAEQQQWLDPSQVDTLVFVLDGKLRTVPMSALYDPNTQQYLIQKYAIATTFGNLEFPKNPPSRRFRALVAGLSGDINTAGFAPLTYVPVEIASIQKTLERTKTLQNRDFTKDSLESEINTAPYTIVHLATHGEFGFTREETFLLTATQGATNRSESALAVEKIDLNQLDTLLRSRTQAPIDLLVLSACETATGDDREVLGIAGMAVQAGARSTLATLWSIDDSSTAVLMRAFYDALVNQQLSKAQALRYAQRQLIQNPAYQPADWAPYLLVGDWR